MPTFDDDEKSVQAAQPVDLYTIVTPTTTYYLTSYSQNISYGGNTYTAAAISRDNVTINPHGQGRELTMYVSLDHALSQDLLVGGIPQSSVSIQVDTYMVRANATRTQHLGYITSIASDGVQVKLLAPHKLDVKIGGVKLPVLQSQRLCQHGLYDTGCTINPASFNVATTVSSISVDGLTITIGTIGGNPDNWAQYGKIVRFADGEPRAVMSHVGTAIVVDVPFRTLNNGDSITLYAGCDHMVTTCKTKFSNVINYGGHPLLPTVNIQSPVGIGVLQQT
jgi:uncharacterized phage protein (TIGR02218 family)